MNMKQLSVSLLLLGIIVALNGANVSADNPSGSTGKQSEQNILAPQHGKKTVFNLLKNSQPAFAILIPAKPSTSDLKAAEMLKQALNAGTGKQFKIVKASSYHDGAVFSLGATALLKKSGIKPKTPLVLEGYLIKEQGGNFFLLHP